jgi:hypothetical protein
MKAMPQIDVISRFQQSAPVDVTGMANALGLSVWESPDLPAGVSGKLFEDRSKGGSSGYSIVVRSSEPFVRKRFTVAHEIGHFLLHRNRIGSYLVEDEWLRSNLSTREEVEANQFAAEALMPKHLISRYAGLYGPNPSVLAPIFKVSEAAMRIRLGMETKGLPVEMTLTL